MRVSRPALLTLPMKLGAFLLLATIPCQAPGQTGARPVERGEPAAYSQGEALVREHRWDEGLAVLQPLLQGKPPNLRVLNLVGIAYTGKGDPGKGDEYFEAALKVDAGFLPALKNLGVNEFGLGNYKAAEKHLLAALRGSPDDPVVNVYLGEAAFEQQDYAHAAEYLQHAGSRAAENASVRLQLAVSWLKTDNKNSATNLLDGLPAASLPPKAQAGLGVALAEADLPTLAIPYLEAAKAAYPAATDVAYDLALCELRSRQFSQAAATIHDLIAAGRETSELDNLLAEAEEGNKDTQAAVDALRKAIAIDPNDDNNYLDFASLCINHQAFSDATKVLAVGLGVHPRSSRLLFERGILNAMQDHFDEAEKDFQDSASLAPKDNSGYIGLGVTYMETGNTARAVEILRKRSAGQPKDANLSYLLGEALIRSGAQPGEPLFIEAQQALERSVRLDATLSAPHATLGSLYLQQGKVPEAVDQLEEAKRIDPNDKSAYSHLAVAYRRLGEKEKAKEALIRLQEINAQERQDPRPKMKDEGVGAASASPPADHSNDH